MLYIPLDGYSATWVWVVMENKNVTGKLTEQNG